MQTVALEKARATLADLLRQVAGGEEFTLTQNGEPKAKLSPMTPKAYRKNGILVHHTGKKISSEDVANASAEEFSSSPWCAFAPGKEAWKRDGNFFTSEELRQMDNADDMAIYQPLAPVLSAD